MASIQDISGRVEVLEDKLDFLMRHIPVMWQEGIIEPKTVKSDMLGLYYRSKQLAESPKLAKNDDIVSAAEAASAPVEY